MQVSVASARRLLASAAQPRPNTAALSGFVASATARRTHAAALRSPSRLFASSSIRLAAAAALTTMAAAAQPRVQKPAPHFEAEALVNGEFKKVSLDDYKGKYVVLFFYPLDFTFVCPTEIIAYSDRVQEFRDIGCEVVAASVDSKFSHLAWTQQDRRKGGLGEMKIPIISDITKQVSRDYGVLLEDGPDAGVALRGLFIIDGKGVLRQMTVNDLPVGRDVDETLRLVKAFQFTDEHGEVCPAGWRPGAKTMKADPKGSLEFFGTGATEGAAGQS